MRHNRTPPRLSGTGINETAADTLARARRVTEQLEAVGIKLGGYRLTPPLGGPSGYPGVQERQQAADRNTRNNPPGTTCAGSQPGRTASRR